MDDYLKRLEAETERDNSLHDYLEWVQRHDIEESFYQLPKDWLNQLITTQFDDILAVINLRTALSFKEVDYLLLATEGGGFWMHIITSDPGALKPEETEHGLTAIDQLGVHPALVSLSTTATTDPHFQDIPKLVLPLGRLLRGRPRLLLQFLQAHTVRNMRLEGKEIGDDALGSGTLPTSITYLEALVADVLALIDYIKFSLADQALLIEHFEESLLYMMNGSLRSGELTINRTEALREAYERKILDILTGNVQISQVSRETLEKKRRELWHDVKQIYGMLEETGYVAVIDAVDSKHPVWILRSSESEGYDDDGGNVLVASNTSAAGKIYPEAKAWLDSYGKSDDGKSMFIEAMMERPTTVPLVVNTVDLTKSRAMFTEAQSKQSLKDKIHKVK